jgi:hypothetical protein
MSASACSHQFKPADIAVLKLARREHQVQIPILTVVCGLEEVRLFNTADFDCSRSGSFRTCLGVRLRLVLFIAMGTASIHRGKSMIWIGIEVYRTLRRFPLLNRLAIARSGF